MTEYKVKPCLTCLDCGDYTNSGVLCYNCITAEKQIHETDLFPVLVTVGCVLSLMFIVLMITISLV